MKRILSVITTLCCTAALAAPPEAPASVAEGRAPAATETAVCATFAESSAAGFPESKYIRPVTERHRQSDGSFTGDFIVPFAWVNRQVVLHVESATGGYAVEVNGRRTGHTMSGALPSDFVVTKSSAEGRNTVRIVPLSGSDGVLSPAASDFAVGRIYVQSPATVRIRDVVTHTSMGADGAATAEVGIVMKSEALNPKTTRVYYELLLQDTIRMHYGYKELTLDMRREDTVRFAVRLPDSCLWALRNPRMLRLDVRTQVAGRNQEVETFRLGFREVEVSPNGLVSINGRPTALITARVRPQATAAEVAELRNKGYNTLHPTTDAVDRRLYDICDSLGMYIIAQTPIDTSAWGDSRRRGGNPSNDAGWTASYVDLAEGTFHAVKLHPSVVAFSMAENSANGICLYETYLRLKSFGDPRPVIYDAAAGEWNSDRLRRFFSPAEAGIAE